MCSDAKEWGLCLVCWPKVHGCWYLPTWWCLSRIQWDIAVNVWSITFISSCIFLRNVTKELWIKVVIWGSFRMWPYQPQQVTAHHINVSPNFSISPTDSPDHHIQQALQLTSRHHHVRMSMPGLSLWQIFHQVLFAPSVLILLSSLIVIGVVLHGDFQGYCWPDTILYTGYSGFGCIDSMWSYNQCKMPCICHASLSTPHQLCHVVSICLHTMMATFKVYSLADQAPVPTQLLTSSIRLDELHCHFIHEYGE